MSNNSNPIPTRPTRSTEKTVWWIAFGVLTLSILLMLGLWN